MYGETLHLFSFKDRNVWIVKNPLYSGSALCVELQN